MNRLSLNGAWQVEQVDGSVTAPATVPGCVHTDLLSAGLLADPFYRDAEHAAQWVGEAGWRYRRTFDVPAGFLEQPDWRKLKQHCASNRSSTPTRNEAATSVVAGQETGMRGLTRSSARMIMYVLTSFDVRTPRECP